MPKIPERPLAPHVRAALGRAAQSKRPETGAARPPAAHVEAALGAIQAKPAAGAKLRPAPPTVPATPRVQAVRHRVSAVPTPPSMAARPAPSQAAAQPKVTGARLEPRASVIQRLKLSTLGVIHGFAVKQFLTSKAVSHPYYIFIPSVAKPGWHLTIPVTRNLSAAEAADYEFYEYHVSEEGVENIHYQYNYSHKQQHSDALGATKWSTADAVVREIFRVTPVPLHTFMQRVRLTLLKGGQFATLAALDKALKQAATYLEISEQELVAKLNSDEKTRLSYWDDVRKFMPA